MQTQRGAVARQNAATRSAKERELYGAALHAHCGAGVQKFLLFFDRRDLRPRYEERWTEKPKGQEDGQCQA